MDKNCLSIGRLSLCVVIVFGLLFFTGQHVYRVSDMQGAW